MWAKLFIGGVSLGFPGVGHILVGKVARGLMWAVISCVLFTVLDQALGYYIAFNLTRTLFLWMLSVGSLLVFLVVDAVSFAEKGAVKKQNLKKGSLLAICYVFYYIFVPYEPLLGEHLVDRLYLVKIKDDSSFVEGVHAGDHIFINTSAQVYTKGDYIAVTSPEKGMMILEVDEPFSVPDDALSLIEQNDADDTQDVGVPLAAGTANAAEFSDIEAAKSKEAISAGDSVAEVTGNAGRQTAGMYVLNSAEKVQRTAATNSNDPAVLMQQKDVRHEYRCQEDADREDVLRNAPDGIFPASSKTLPEAGQCNCTRRQDSGHSAVMARVPKYINGHSLEYLRGKYSLIGRVEFRFWPAYRISVL
ncbi:hypothetical protein [Oleidesulfovibrio sp.]|uniref:hypothetical protein n=1 Tax=Oleidesulfovibrio sp. TaxID=2909707 RepID=UPI003A8A08FC